MVKREDDTRLSHLRGIVSGLPEKPGSYQFYDKEHTIIYVGKAKNLRSRVSTYFHAEVDRMKTRILVDHTWDITYTVVNTEEDALLLENNLIKKYNPKYNVLLKDGKTYPSIIVTKEEYPRIYKTRRIDKKRGSYYGPYSNVGAMEGILELIRKLYHPRSCRTPISEEGVRAGKYAVCLEYHIKNCLAPCSGRQSKEEYRRNIREAQEILKGNTRHILRQMREQMDALSEQLRFEEAEMVKRRYMLIATFCKRSEVVSHTIDNVDVCTITDDENTAYINYMHVSNGSINQSFTFEYRKRIDEPREELLALGIVEMRERFASASGEIIVPFPIETTLEGVDLTVPQKGDKKTLLELSLMNGRQYKADRLKQAEKLNPEQRSVRLMKEIQKSLSLPTLPYHIETFDNSNISGSDPVAACVVFKGLKPSKKDYRKYNIKTVEGADDYASMREVARRRYTRMVEERTPLPDLIITDGGKGQMSAVRDVVCGEMGLSIPIAGLAKDHRHRTNELLYGNPPVVVGMKADSELFRLLTRIQDEVHRFAITFHRDKRSKHALHSELDDIKGIGAKTKEALLGKLKTVKAIKAADIETLTAIIGKAKANIIRDYFKEKAENENSSTKS